MKTGYVLLPAKFVAALGAVSLALPSSAGLAASRADIEGVKPSELLKLPFSPPISTDLAYDMTITKSEPGKKPSATKVKQLLRFEREANGYTLVIKFLQVSKDGITLDLRSEASRKRLPVQLRPFFAPVALDVAQDGTLVRVQEWPKIQRAIEDIPNMMAAMEKPENRESARAIGRQSIKRFLSLTPEQAPELMLKGWPSVFGFGGTELENGAEYQEDTETPAALLPISIPGTKRFSLSRESSGAGLHYHLVNEPDSQKSGAAISRYLLGMSEGLDALGRSNLEKAADLVRGMSIRDQLDITFDPGTGLTELATIERRVTIANAGEAEERIDIRRSRSPVPADN